MRATITALRWVNDWRLHWIEHRSGTFSTASNCSQGCSSSPRLCHRPSKDYLGWNANGLFLNCMTGFVFPLRGIRFPFLISGVVHFGVVVVPGSRKGRRVAL